MQQVVGTSRYTILIRILSGIIPHIRLGRRRAGTRGIVVATAVDAATTTQPAAAPQQSDTTNEQTRSPPASRHSLGNTSSRASIWAGRPSPIARLTSTPVYWECFADLQLPPAPESQAGRLWPGLGDPPSPTTRHRRRRESPLWRLTRPPPLTEPR